MGDEMNGWTEWGRHVRAELERQGKALDALNGKIDQLRVEVAQLQVKASLWGGVIGSLAALGMKFLGG